MSKVITLEGLHTTSPDSKYSKCSRKVAVFSSTLNRNVDICVEDLERASKEANIPAAIPAQFQRKRGRPKGSTVKAGAKKPTVKACASPRWVTKGKRSFCQCHDTGNSQMLSNKACGRSTKGKTNA